MSRNPSSTGRASRDMLEAALHYATPGCYAETGIPVLPCRPDKRPLTRHGVHDATRDRDAIRSWFDRDPEPLVGLAVGMAQIMVLDLDRGHDGLPDGEEWLHAFEHTFGQLPYTLCARTPNGGTHRFFGLPGGTVVRSRNGAVAPHVDIKSAGGYVIAPPSRSRHGRYEWDDESAGIAAAPAALLEAVQAEKARRGEGTTAPVVRLGDRLRLRGGELADLRTLKSVARTPYVDRCHRCGRPRSGRFFAGRAVPCHACRKEGLRVS
jgi:hypothetical protein